MSKSTETDIEIVSDPRIEQLRAGIPDDPGAPGLDRLKEDYRDLNNEFLYYQREAARCNVVARYKLETAMKRLQAAGLTWEEMMEELRTWH